MLFCVRNDLGGLKGIPIWGVCCSRIGGGEAASSWAKDFRKWKDWDLSPDIRFRENSFYWKCQAEKLTFPATRINYQGLIQGQLELLA